MDIFSSLTLNIVGSVIGSILLIIGAGIFSSKVRWVLTATLGRLLDIDTEYVFKDAKDAETDLGTELRRAKTVDIFTGRGNQLQRPTFGVLFTNQPNKRLVRVLLPVTTQQNTNIDWTAKREEELGQFDKAFRPDFLKRQIEAVKTFLEPYVSGVE